MKNKARLELLVLCLAVLSPRLPARAEEPSTRNTIIRAQPLHAGRIDPKLFGNFIELLDDVVPGMWAQMLNDRSFEGVTRAADWCYYDGSLDICDRQWDSNPTWGYDAENPFNGARSAKVTATASRPGTLTQSGLAVKKGMSYEFTGFFRSDSPHLKATVRLKVPLPTENWLTLASAPLSAFSKQWQKQALQLASIGGTDRVVFELHVEGEGHLWADKLSLMPGDNLEGWRQDVIEATREVHPSIVRWGGSAVDPGAYRWKNGIGDRDQRVPFPNKNWGRIDPNDVGIDEFCQFCQLTAVEPLICVSFADGAQSAGELVEYCNGSAQSKWGAKRASNGHPASYRVKYWQIGNEISGDDPHYLDAIGEFLRLMRQADPAIAILSSLPTRKLLDRVGAGLDYIAPHHYTQNLAECDQDFQNLAQMLDGIPGCGQVKIAVTEWNIDGGSWGLGRARMMTLAGALMNARYLHVVMRHSDKVEIACRSNMANSYCGAIYETSAAGFGLLKRPSYYIMQLYARHARPLPLTLVQPNSGPDLFACESLDKKSLAIFAVNLKRQPLNWSFAFDGFAGRARAVKAEAVCDVLNAGQPDVMNHWNEPERVRIVQLMPQANSITLPPLSATALECEIE
ncbi:MAG TPA: alpha-L-arabinofuranosidase C-terminal domain-containing protein [Verrucomicrobiae bacterium]|nr:alpha-L-arabinofuranosidase C-terminal domain-containing protein [Verrucomicrobiae bacterium]